jgi:hypothetical protein
MANNDDNTKNSRIIGIGLPAAILATTGRPEVIEKGSNCEKIFSWKESIKRVIKTNFIFI